MTEDEAKTKWCPFARVFVETDERADASPAAGVNRLETKGTSEPDLDWPTPRCIGSACMAWRGKWADHFKGRADAAFRRDGTRLTPTGADIEGFCGLAGAPA